MIPEPATPISPGNLLNMHILDPITDLLNQKFWGWGSAACAAKSCPGNSDARDSAIGKDLA